MLAAVIVLALIVAALAWLALRVLHALAAVPPLLLWSGLALAAALAAHRPLGHLARFALAPGPARRHYPRMLWASWRWRWLARAAGLAYHDQHRPKAGPRMPGSTSVQVITPPTARLRYPRATFRADCWGWTVTLRTVPRVGRAELAKAATGLADEWRCARVGVTQPAPGRVQVRAVRRDPLTAPLPVSVLPELDPARNGWRIMLGRDEWGTDRWLPLVNVPALLMAGVPGSGKTSLALSAAYQLAPWPEVQFAAVLDGKNGGDFEVWRPRLGLLTGDDLADAADALSDVHKIMRSRLAAAWPDYGTRNLWSLGPTPALPLLVTIVDEAHSYLDLESVKGDREAEQLVRHCRHMTGQLVRKARAAMMTTWLITQKATTDAIPSASSAQATWAGCFAVRTVDAAVAALGDGIRSHPDVCPTGLQDPAYVGVMTCTLRTGLDPFTRLRVPLITEAEAGARAIATARQARPADRTGVLVLAPDDVTAGAA